MLARLSRPLHTATARGRAFLAEAEEALSRAELQLAADRAEEGLWAIASSGGASAGSLRERRALKNVLGISLHLDGRFECANEPLSAALRLAEEAGRCGETHDAFVDLAGCMSDLAVNHVALGELDAAQKQVKRAMYMCQRAYRPSASARACLLSAQGLLLEARGTEPDAALAAHREARLLLRAASVSGRTSAARWSQAARAGVIRVLLGQGDAAAAHAVALEGSVEDEAARPGSHAEAAAGAPARPSALDALLAEATACVTVVELARSRARTGEPTMPGAVEGAAASLADVAARLEALLGPSHPQTERASANAMGADIAAAGRPAAEWPVLEQHWQPAVGLGIYGG